MEVGGGDWKPGKALQSSGCAKQWEDSEVLRTMRGVGDPIWFAFCIGPEPEWMWGAQSESCWYISAKIITCPKETANQTMIRNSWYSDWKWRSMRQGHHYFPMESWSLSLACSFISSVLALLAGGINFFCSGRMNSQGLRTYAVIDSLLF